MSPATPQPASRHAATPQARVPRETTDQARACWAWDKVKDGVDKDYVNLVKSVPTLIMSSGLIQTLAFLAAKAEKNEAHRRLLADLGDGKEPDPLIADLVASPSPRLRALTEEVLAKLRWLRHFAPMMQKESRGD